MPNKLERLTIKEWEKYLRMRQYYIWIIRQDRVDRFADQLLYPTIANVSIEKILHPPEHCDDESYPFDPDRWYCDTLLFIKRELEGEK